MSSAQTQEVDLDNIIYMVQPEIIEEVSKNEDDINELYKVAYRIAFKLMGNKEAAEDVAIESVSRLVEKNLDKETYAKAYVARVSSRLVISQWRKDAIARKYAPLVITDESTFESEYAKSDLRLDLRKALKKLTKRQREMIVLRYLADLPEEDVATNLNCAVGTVKSTTHDALAKLKTMVEVKS